jgi:5,10-methylenetetrahydromethanopterin reductase
MVGDGTRIADRLNRLSDKGFREIIYTPTGPDVGRELRAFIAPLRGRSA